tara:strand:+ start:442 stop:1542 length:1101 start_codon:yes stop_codon:yes gene_type:complete
MKVPYVDLKAQYLSLKSEMDLKIKSIIEKTAFIGGEELKNFSVNFAELYGADYFVPLANGTDALYIAMKMMGIGQGDEVITTASSWISTSETISQTGAKAVFVDIDDFFTIDSSLIENKITNKTKAIIPVHLYGQMADMSSIMVIANKYKLRVIEDCAQSHFSEIDGKRAGLFGDVGTFSFYPGKNLGAYGDAGGLVTNNSELAMKIKRFANHGSLKKHHHEVEGMNSRMDSLQAGILNIKLPYILNWTDDRIRVANRYFNGLKGVDYIELPKVRPNSKHSFHVFGIKLKNRDALKDFLEKNGISCQIHYPKAMPFMPAYKHLGALQGDYPNAHSLQNQELSLPIYPEMTTDQIDYVVDKIKTFFK